MIELLLTCFLQGSVTGLIWKVDQARPVTGTTATLSLGSGKGDDGLKGVVMEDRQYLKVTLAIPAKENETVRLPDFVRSLPGSSWCYQVGWRSIK